MRKILRKIKRFFDNILGDFSDEVFWKYLHLFKRDWKEVYEVPHYYLGHKKFLIDLITNDKKTKKVLELGCGDGINLRKIARKKKSIELTGLDINKVVIKKAYLKIKNLNYKINLIRDNLKNLRKYSNNQFNVVFSDSALMYIDKKNIQNVLKQAIRISKIKAVVCELHTNKKSFYNDKWIHNYVSILKNLQMKIFIKIHNLQDSKRSGDRKKFGKIIEVKKNEKKI